MRIRNGETIIRQEYLEWLITEREKLKEQVSEANDVIKRYKESYKTFPNGTYFFVDNNIANDYIKKWSVK